MEKNRTHINPIVGDKITFLQTSEETNGELSLLELELIPLAKGTPLHYHDRFAETFTVIQGELTIRCGKKLQVLNPGESFTVPIGKKHCFFNTSQKPVKALVELRPGSIGFENGIKIAYGLARDGECNNKGIPKRLDYLALLFDMSEGRVPGFLSLLMPVLKRVAQKARKKGLEKTLVERYCQ